MIKIQNRSRCFALTAAAGLAACGLHAQGTLSATATLAETGTAGSEYEYSLVLDNTGSNPINALWYGWIQFEFDLPSSPTSVATTLAGWSGAPDGNSIQFQNVSGSGIAPGGIGAFTFDSTANPAAITAAPSGDSVAYGTVASMNADQQSVAGVASGPFSPTFVPEPSALGLLVTGLAGLSAWQAGRRSGA
jgi:hypothetical protein